MARKLAFWLRKIKCALVSGRTPGASDLRRVYRDASPLITLSRERQKFHDFGAPSIPPFFIRALRRLSLEEVVRQVLIYDVPIH
jgi:hypothetical protein